MTDLEDKVLMLKMRLSKFKKDYEEILKQETEKDKAVLVFDIDDPHLLIKNEQH